MSNTFINNITFCSSFNPSNRDDIIKLRAIVLPSLAAMRRDRVLNAAFLRHDKDAGKKVKILRIEANMIKRTIEFAHIRQYYKTKENNA